MVPAALMDEVMTIFDTRSRDDYIRLRAEIADVLDPWWDALAAMILMAAEEGLPNAETYEV